MAAATAARWGRGEREPREIGSGTDEVDGEASVAKSAGGAAEEGAAVGRADDGVVNDDGAVAGVRVRVAQAEDGLVAAPDQGSGGLCRRREHGEEEEGRISEAARGGERLVAMPPSLICSSGRPAGLGDERRPERSEVKTEREPRVDLRGERQADLREGETGHRRREAGES
jgi:hypothetical protein